MGFNNAQEMGKPITVKDEGVPLTTNASSFDFTGAGVTGTNVGAAVTENIPGGGGGGGHTIQDEGVSLTQRTKLNFVGAGVTVTDAGAGPDETTVTIPGGSSPNTTKGDIHGYSTVDARIPIGADTFVLTADSTQALGLKWAAPSAAAATVDYTTSFMMMGA